MYLVYFVYLIYCGVTRVVCLSDVVWCIECVVFIGCIVVNLAYCVCMIYSGVSNVCCLSDVLWCI